MGNRVHRGGRTLSTITGDSVGHLAILIPSFERSLPAASKSPKTIQVYGDGARQLLDSLRAQEIPTRSG